MKQPTLLCLVLGIGILVGRPADRPAPRAAAAGARMNGDVNGDGAIDISDAVYLLSSLFLGGTAPVPIECRPPGVKGLPATGQTTCCDGDRSNAVEIACANAAFPGQDGYYQAGCPSEGRFIENLDGTVTDTCTALLWQKHGASTVLGWGDALKLCESLELAGYDDWRLPNVRELQSLVDYGRMNPAMNPVFGAASEWYWSSTCAGSDGMAVYAWGVDFYSGHVKTSGVNGNPHSVRAVRDAP